MTRRVYYGSLQAERKKKRKRNILIILSIIVFIGIIIWTTMFFGVGYRKDVGAAVKESIEEITQLKLQIKEKDDQIDMLNKTIQEYEAELAIRPTLEPLPIVPPNSEVLAGQPTVAPTTKPKSTRATAKPVEQPQATADAQVASQEPQYTDSVATPNSQVQPTDGDAALPGTVGGVE